MKKCVLQEHRQLHLLELIELSGRYDGKGRNQVQSKIKEALLVLLSCFLETDPNMRKVLDDFATETDKLRLETYKGIYRIKYWVLKG